MSLRAILRLIGGLLWLGVCLPMWAVGRLYGGERVWVRRYLALLGWMLGLRTQDRGRPAGAPALLVGNHISWLDILALGGRTEVSFIAKAEIADWPLVGFLARVAGCVFVARDRRAATRTQADAVAESLRGGQSFVLFAEGGTGDGITIAPFRAGLFASAIEAGVKVQPVAIDYGRRRADLAWPNGEGFGRVAKRMLNQRGEIPVTLRFLAPLDTAQLDRKALAARAHQAIVAALD
jgi:1-acyl-sn-glycerol-3-phosphate acyltransferase